MFLLARYWFRKDTRCLVAPQNLQTMTVSWNDHKTSGPQRETPGDNMEDDRWYMVTVLPPPRLAVGLSLTRTVNLRSGTAPASIIPSDAVDCTSLLQQPPWEVTTVLTGVRADSPVSDISRTRGKRCVFHDHRAHMWT